MRRTLVSIACMVAAMGTVIAGAGAANAVVYTGTGSNHPYINSSSGSPYYSAGTNTIGWPRGTVKASYYVYVGPSASGPWTEIAYHNNVCSNTTSCGVGSVQGECPGSWIQITGYGSGKNGEAPPETVIKYIDATGGTASNPDGQPAVKTASISNKCSVTYQPI